MLRFKYAYLCLFPLLISGCMYNFNTLEDLDEYKPEYKPGQIYLKLIKEK
jgi:hypothetical protein